MLIKAVGQKEMVPGETIIQESNPGDCLDSITGRMEDNLRQDYKIDNVKDLNIVIPPVEPLENYCGLNERTGVEVVHTKCTSLVHEVKVSADGCFDVNSEMSSFIASRENLPIQMKSTHDNQGEPCTSVNKSLNDKIQENFSDSGIQIDNTLCSLQQVIVNVVELNDQSKISDINFSSASPLAYGICKRVEEKESIIDYEILRGSAAETVNLKLDSLHGVTSKMESIEDHAVEKSSSNFGNFPVFPGREILCHW
ncbi:uncharacterized protein Fot_14505 [Forsythia ovata]|uniref:Uncharacterized protein n=1 Tax=Forsythia ovata TaxID=205694 RepID=A0ABD1W6T3_9LAMI